MMCEGNGREQDIFNGCLSIPPGRRPAYLKSVCGSDAELAERVERLLAAHWRAERAGEDHLDCIAGRFLAETLDVDPGGASPPEEDEPRSGDTAGAWRLVTKIGQGGMASVWLAEPSDGHPGPPVAIKLPLDGSPRRILVERMAREREVLMTLNHRNIARLWEAGLTEGGRPYLALEYVEGQPITQFCNRRFLGVKARLDLFLQLAGAIAYAHNNLIVHRDLKPSNVLVTESGDVRVLDFGIAKLLEGGVTCETELTRHSGPALTLDYASPEQILGNPLTVASDVYSLAVILYEMLTGSRPYRNKRLSRAAVEDAILMEEPRRPSDLVTDPVHRGAIRGDLDTILLKALKKDVAARYATVEAFAEDLRRYLQHRPVHARPDSRPYRFAKFVRRHRIGVAAAAAVALTLILASAGIAWQARLAFAQKVRAETTNRFLVSILHDAHSYAGSGKPLSAVDLLRNAEARVSPAALPDAAGRVQVLNIIGAALLSQQEVRQAEAVLDRSIRESGALPGGHPLALRARLMREWTRLFRGQVAEARLAIGPLLSEMKRSPAILPVDLVGAQRVRSWAALEYGDYPLAVAAAEEALQIAKTRLNPRHNQFVLALIDLCDAQTASGDPAARQTGERALARALEAYDGSGTHPNVLKARVARAQTLAASGQLEVAIHETSRAIEDAAALFGPSARMVGADLLQLARLQLRAGRPGQALASAGRATQILSACLDLNGTGYAAVLEVRGAALLESGRLPEALVDLSRAEELFRNAFGPAHPSTIRLSRLRQAAASGAIAPRPVVTANPSDQVPLQLR